MPALGSLRIGDEVSVSFQGTITDVTGGTLMGVVAKDDASLRTNRVYVDFLTFVSRAIKIGDTVTISDPEPDVKTVLVDVNGVVWQRVESGWQQTGTTGDSDYSEIAFPAVVMGFVPSPAPIVAVVPEEQPPSEENSAPVETPGSGPVQTPIETPAVNPTEIS